VLFAAPGEALGLTAGRATLHVDDLAVPEREHLVALATLTVGSEPGRRADDLVADLCELGLDLDRRVSAFLDLEPQDLTGLVGPSS
jgi:hypothetical protein